MKRVLFHEEKRTRRGAPHGAGLEETHAGVGDGDITAEASPPLLHLAALLNY